MLAEIKLWHRVSKKTRKQNLYVDVVFGNTKSYENRKQIQTKISLEAKYWNKDKNQLKRTHPNYEVLSHTIRELRDRIEKGIAKDIESEYIATIENKFMKFFSSYVMTAIKEEDVEQYVAKRKAGRNCNGTCEGNRQDICGCAG